MNNQRITTRLHAWEKECASHYNITKTIAPPPQELPPMFPLVLPEWLYLCSIIFMDAKENHIIHQSRKKFTRARWVSTRYLLLGGFRPTAGNRHIDIRLSPTIPAIGKVNLKRSRRISAIYSLFPLTSPFHHQFLLSHLHRPETINSSN